MTTEEKLIAETLIEALYELDFENKILSQDHEGIYDYRWKQTLKSFGFSCAYGASRFVVSHPDLPGWVIKTDYLNRAHYCAREAALYQTAIEENMASYFCPVLSLGVYHGHEFYVAEKMSICDEYDMSYELSNRYCAFDPEEDCSALADYLVDEAIPEEILEYAYGELADEIIDWTFHKNIDDIHIGNIGVSNSGNIVIIDYASFGLAEVYYD